MGILSDRTKSKRGRRRLYFLLGAAPVFISWVTLWYSFGIANLTAKIVYYAIAVIFFSTAFTIVMVPYNALLADMTSDYDKRSAYTGMRLSFSAGSAIVCGILPGMITGTYENAKVGYLVMALIFGAVFSVGWLAVYRGTWENTQRSQNAGFTYQDFLSVFKNKSFRSYSAIFVCSQIAIDVTMAVAVFFLNVSLQKPLLFVPTMAAILIMQLLFIIVFTIIAQKFNKKMPGIIAAAIWIVTNIVIFTFTPQTPDIAIIAVCALIGIGAAGCNLVSWSILPDISDVDELMTGERREGLYSGVSTLIRKLSGGLAIGTVGILLDAFHYSEKAVSVGAIEPITIIGIKIMFCLCPVLFLLIMLLVIHSYKLGKREFAILQEVLSSLRKGLVGELNSEQALICEQITGVKVEELILTGNTLNL